MQLPLWGAAAVIVIWGLWQALEFRRGLLAEVHQNEFRDHRSEVVEPDPALDPLPPADDAATGSGDAVRQVFVVRSTRTDIPALMETDVPPPPEMHNERWEEHKAAATEPAPGVAFTSEELVTRGFALLNAGRVVEGRDALNAALAQTHDEARAAQLRQVLTEINTGVFLGSALLPEDSAARYVEIQSGDSFLKLARTFEVSAAYLEQINPSLNPRNLKPLTGVKIVRGPFALRLFKHASRLDLYVRELFVRSFAVELPEGNYLPKGEYRIASETKLQVGSRTWLGFEGAEPATVEVAIGWIYGSAGPRGTSARDRSSGIHVADADLLQLYNVLIESRSHLRVEP